MLSLLVNTEKIHPIRAAQSMEWPLQRSGSKMMTHKGNIDKELIDMKIFHGHENFTPAWSFSEVQGL